MGHARRRRIISALVIALGVGIGLVPEGPATGSADQGGAQSWVARYAGLTTFEIDSATSVAANPAHRDVYVTGQGQGTTSASDYATLAYDDAGGGLRWLSRYNGPANGDDVATAIAARPDGNDLLADPSAV